jgi:hypothetical protein
VLKTKLLILCLLFSHKVPFRDRRSSSRNYRGGYSNDRSDHSDKDGSWINSKQRNPNRSYGRNQSERSGMRSDRHATTDENQTDRQPRAYRMTHSGMSQGLNILCRANPLDPQTLCASQRM